MDEELNKAAEEYAKGYFDDCSAAKRAADHGFIAGAKWQEEQEKGYSPWLAIPKLKEAALEFGEQAKLYEVGGQSFSEDMVVAFTRGAEWQNEQMMKEAVEGEVRKDGTVGYFEFSNEKQFQSLLEQFQDCDKVRIIIVKEN